MTRKLLAPTCFVLFLAAGITGTAQAPKQPTPSLLPSPPYVKLPETLKASRTGEWVVVAAETNGTALQWYLPDPGLEEVPLSDLFPPELVAKSKGKIYKAEKVGTYRVVAWTARGEIPSGPAVCLIIVGTPKPPTPGPGPGPGPGPDPDPNHPAPIPAKGLRVLIVYDSKALGKMPSAQVNALYSRKLSDYLDANCPPGPDGKTKEWRIWSSAEDVRNESKLWQDAYARPRTGLPWIVVSNGTTGTEEALPADTDKILELVKKYVPGV